MPHTRINPLETLTPAQDRRLVKHAKAHGDDYALDLVVACACGAGVATPCRRQKPGVVCFGRRLSRVLKVGKLKSEAP